MATTKKANPVAEAVTALAEAIKALEAKIDALPFPRQIKDAPVPEMSPAEEKEGPEMPFPQEWRNIIDTILSPAFKAAVKYRDDANFELVIFVPKQYSNASQVNWDLNKEDRRLKVIENAAGVHGVREYVEQISENLGVETRLRIASDRVGSVA